MPDLPISGLPASSALTGNEISVFVQGGVTVRGTLNDIADFIGSAGGAFIPLSGTTPGNDLTNTIYFNPAGTGTIIAVLAGTSNTALSSSGNSTAISAGESSDNTASAFTAYDNGNMQIQNIGAVNTITFTSDVANGRYRLNAVNGLRGGSTFTPTQPEDYVQKGYADSAYVSQLLEETFTIPAIANQVVTLANIPAAIEGVYLNGNKLLPSNYTASNYTVTIIPNYGGDVSVVYFDTLGAVNYQTSKNIFCVVRNTAGTWGIINDVSHKPSVNVTGVANDTTANFILSYDTMPKVGALVGNVDETYAKYGLFVGTSVGASSAGFYIYKQGISGYIAYNGTAWVITLNNSLMSASDFAMAMDGTGKLTVTHTAAALQNEAFGTDVSPRLGTTAYNLYLGSVGSTTFEVYFKDYSGATVLTPTNQMKFYFTRVGSWQVPNTMLGVSGSNIWITGNSN